MNHECSVSVVVVEFDFRLLSHVPRARDTHLEIFRESRVQRIFQEERSGESGKVN